VIRTFLRAVAVLLVCGAVVSGVGYRLRLLYHHVHHVQRAPAGPRPADGGERVAAGVPEDERLFLELLDAGLLTPRADGGLERVPEDYLLLQRIDTRDEASAAVRERRRTERRLLEQLDASAVGSIVRTEITRWNETRRVVAVRDDRPSPDGARTTRWSAFNAKGRPLVCGAIVPETFGFIHAGRLQPGFSDWLSVSGAPGPVTFRTEVDAAAAHTLTIQVLGGLVRPPPGAKVETLRAEPPWPCPEAPVAHVVRVPIRPSPAPVWVELVATPSMNCAPRIHGLAISRTTNSDASTSTGYASYSWRPVPRSRPAGTFVLRTRDGVVLTDPAGSGRPTEATYALGLLPIVGTGGGDTLSVSGLLATTARPPRALEVSLTIDSRIQDAARQALAWGVERFRNDRWTGERKAALLVLDADSGAVLAAAGEPTVPVGVHPWDYASFSATYPLRDPATVIAWEVIDKHNTPGSTFKPVTALALMTEQDASFRAKMRTVFGGLDAAALHRLTGLSYGSTEFVAYRGAKPIPNFGGANLGRYANRRQRDPACVSGRADPAATNGGLGLEQAVQFSLNAWFARMALMVEQPKIDAYAERVEKHAGARLPAPEMAITHMARWLGIDDQDRLDLASNVPASAALARIAGNAFDVLYAELARSTLAQMAYNKDDWGARPLMMYTAALNGIGQTISTSPLHMALAAAATASGHRVRPYLFAEWNGAPLPIPPAEPLPVDPDLLRPLRAGLKGVVEAGTAAGAFPRPLACRVYGKTGTAEIDAAREYNSGWFIGWREPGTPGEPRLAIACMTTHATGGYRFGGTACAPVVSRVLQALEAAPQAPNAPAADGNPDA